MRDQALSRRRFLQGSSAVAAGAVLMPGGWPGAVPRSAARAVSARITGATVQPRVYGTERWVQGAKIFDSYVGMPLATSIQKIYMTEGQFYTDPLPVHLTGLARHRLPVHHLRLSLTQLRIESGGAGHVLAAAEQ